MSECCLRYCCIPHKWVLFVSFSPGDYKLTVYERQGSSLVILGRPSIDQTMFVDTNEEALGYDLSGWMMWPYDYVFGEMVDHQGYTYYELKQYILSHGYFCRAEGMTGNVDEEYARYMIPAGDILSVFHAFLESYYQGVSCAEI